MAPSADDITHSPLPSIGHDISRPSSTSTQSSSALRTQQYQGQQNGGIALPGLSALASAAAAPSTQSRTYSSSIHFSTASPTPTSVSGQQQGTPPVCQNCTTSTTPLWRRDEIGSVLCNACGLFLKLHGRPRPISLKTDVIKSRNRVKSSGQAQKKKATFDSNGTASRSEAGTPPPKHPSHRRVSHKASSGDSDRSNSPVSRTTTPALHQPSNNIAPQHMFDHATLTDSPFNHSPSLPALHLRHPSPGSTTSLNDRHLEPPLTYEALQQTNTSYKTRVNELEVINNLFRERVAELEMIQNQYSQMLEQSNQREMALKRRVEDLEHENADLRDESLPHSKRAKVEEVSQYPDPPEPLAVAI